MKKMIVVDGLICYSPEPPRAYTRDSEGHGVWVEDMQQWNLAWLSFPQLDAYVNTEVSIVEIVATIDSETFGTVVGCAHRNADPAFPGLHAALGMAPREFMAATFSGPWENLPAYHVLGESWVTTIRNRIKLAEKVVIANAAAAEAVQRVMGNVVHADFGKRKHTG